MIEMNEVVNQKIEDYKLAQKLVDEGAGEDLHFFLLMIEYLRLSPEERLAKGLARGRRKYFLIRK
jgi:hypothetical protein